MELLSERVVTLEFADLAKRRQLGPIVRPSASLSRAPGAHQSDILRYVAVKIGQLKAGERTEDEYPLIWAVGQAVEEFLFSMMHLADWQPGEITVDGISMNCDGITANDPEWHEDIVEECKATYIAAKGGLAWMEKWMHMHQGREYGYGYGPRIVRWHAVHLRGDYKSFGPVYCQYVVRFTDAECRQTHQMLLNNKDAAMEAARIARYVSGKWPAQEKRVVVGDLNEE